MSDPSNSQPGGAQAPQAPATLDATSLLLLFADRLVPLAYKPTEHPEYTCAFQRVKGGQLAQDLLVCALWELREQGFVE
ncbi:MAG: hypothetical protein ACRDHE_00650, partial [Ktedonobacterales bacterium]